MMKKQKTRKTLFVLKIIGRILQILLIPFKFALLIIPMFALMAYTSYTIDCSGLYQGDLITRTVVDYILEGKNVSDFTQMDERAILSLYTTLVPKEDAPTTIAVGSSRTMQLRADLMGDGFYNAGMTGADYRDVMNAVYLFDRANKMPERVILNLDPWFFRSDSDYLEARADAAVFNEFCAVVLGAKNDYEPPEVSEEFLRADAMFQKASEKLLHTEHTLGELNITSETLGALFEPAYFQGNLRYRERMQESDVRTTEDGEEITFKPLTSAEMQPLEAETKCSDGTVFYAKSFREGSAQQILDYALGQAGTFLRMENYQTLDTAQCTIFEKFVAYLQENDVEVYFMLSPYHPFTYEFQRSVNPTYCPGFFEIEPYVRTFAKEHNIPVIGSYDPTLLNLVDTDFFDGLHVRAEGIEKFFGGLSASGDVLAGTEVDCTVLQSEQLQNKAEQ